MNVPRPVAYAAFALPWIASLVAMGWLCSLRFPPSGVFVADSNLDGTSAWVNPFLPAERTSSPGLQPDGWTGQRVTGDPTYFTARVPGPYETVDVAIEYRPIRQPLMEFGMVHDAEGKQLELRPLYASGLDTSDWRRGTSGKEEGYARAGTSDSRLSDPDPSGLVVWDASATVPLLADPPGVSVVTEVSLRGSHDFYVVPSGREVRMTFTLQAANRKEGSDIAVFRFFRGDEEIGHEAFGASGSRERRMGRTMKHDVVLRDVVPGVYRISFVADDDVFIRSIETTSARWVVGPRVYFGDVVGYATGTPGVNVWTNSRHVVAETFHAEGLQTIELGGKKAKISRTHVATRIDRDDDVGVAVRFLAPKGDLRVVGDGYVAFRDGAFFEPKPRRLTDATDVVRERVVAVLTSYDRPESLEAGWKRSTFRFAVNPSLDRLRFVLSAPGVAARAGAVDVRRITLTYRRDAVEPADWFRIIRQELANAWRRL